MHDDGCRRLVFYISVVIATKPKYLRALLRRFNVMIACSTSLHRLPRLVGVAMQKLVAHSATLRHRDESNRGDTMHKGPPAVQESMARAMRRMGIQLDEVLAWRSAATQSRRNSTASGIVTVIPGQCRLCDHRRYMEHFFSTMESSALVFLLQSDDNRTFDSCLNTIKLVANSRGSRAVVGRQWMTVRHSLLPCNRSHVHNIRGTFPRVQMQACASTAHVHRRRHHRSQCVALACRRPLPWAAPTTGRFTSSLTAATWLGQGLMHRRVCHRTAN